MDFVRGFSADACSLLSRLEAGDDFKGLAWVDDQLGRHVTMTSRMLPLPGILYLRKERLLLEITVDCSLMLLFNSYASNPFRIVVEVLVRHH